MNLEIALYLAAVATGGMAAGWRMEHLRRKSTEKSLESWQAVFRAHECPPTECNQMLCNECSNGRHRKCDGWLVVNRNVLCACPCTPEADNLEGNKEVGE